MKTMVIDFETFFSKTFTLSKQPISQYVRDERFHVFCAGIQVDDNPGFFLREEELRSYLVNDVDWSDTMAVGHHMHFDGFILSDYYAAYPARYGCTLSMARPIFGPNNRLSLDSVAQLIGLPPKDADIMNMMGIRDPSDEDWDLLERRAIGDIERTRAVWDYLRRVYPENELDIIDMTVKMFTSPKIVLDEELVHKVSKDEALRRQNLFAAVRLTETQLRSDKTLATILENRDIEVPTKYSIKRDTIVPAFASNDLDFMAWQLDAELKPYYDARTAAKSTQITARTERLLAAGRAPYKLPVYLNYCGAHTFRFSGGDKLNFQNFSRGSDLRRSLTAPDGYLLAVVDASQIEARICAWLAGQEDLLEQFADPDKDPYCDMAFRVFGTDKCYEKDSMERFIGKTLVLGAGYGMGHKKLQGMLASNKYNPVVFEEGQCKNMIMAYRDTNQHIQKLWWYMGARIHTMAVEQPVQTEFTYKCIEFIKNGVYMPNELVMRYPGLMENEQGDWTYQIQNGGTTKIYGGLLTENIVQSLARILLTEHMRHIGAHYDIVLTVHDEIVALIPESDADEHFAYIQKIATQPPAWAPDLPVACEGGYDKVYSK